MEKEMATHSSVLVWRIPGTEEPGGLPSMGLHSRTWLTRLSSNSIKVYTCYLICNKLRIFWVYSLMFWCRYTLLKSSSLPRCWCTITSDRAMRFCCPLIILSPILSHPLTMWCLRMSCYVAIVLSPMCRYTDSLGAEITNALLIIVSPLKLVE